MRSAWTAISARVAILAFVGALLMPSGVQAACQAVLEPNRDQLVIRHNPLEAAEVHGTIEISIVNRGDSDCVGNIGATLRGEQYGLWPDAGSESILYQLADERAGRDITPRAGRSLFAPAGRTVRLKPGERSLELISFSAFPGASISQGRYYQSLDLNLVASDATILGTRPLTLAVEIIPAALVGVKGELARGRGANRINLGELHQGRQELPLTLYVVSTGGYRVAVSSENRGRLKHSDAKWFVSYRLRLGRHELNLATVDGFEVVSERARFDNYPMQIEIGETTGKRAGSYSDMVTVTVAAL